MGWFRRGEEESGLSEVVDDLGDSRDIFVLLFEEEDVILCSP
jgi:hypothetical protein